MFEKLRQALWTLNFGELSTEKHQKHNFCIFSPGMGRQMGVYMSVSASTWRREAFEPEKKGQRLPFSALILKTWSLSSAMSAPSGWIRASSTRKPLKINISIGIFWPPHRSKIGIMWLSQLSPLPGNVSLRGSGDVVISKDDQKVFNWSQFQIVTSCHVQCFHLECVSSWWWQKSP